MTFDNAKYNKAEGYTCKTCDKHFKLRGGLSQHIRTAKHSQKVKEQELELEILRLKATQGNIINNTTIVIDNSCNIINNNTFVFNTPERKNFSDVLGDIDMDKCLFTDTREGDKRFNPVTQIQKRVLNLIPSERPVIIKGNKVMCKNNDIEYIDEKAKTEIGLSICKKMKQQVSLIDTKDFEEEMIIQGGLYQSPTEFIELFLHKQKENLTYKQTDK